LLFVNRNVNYCIIDLPADTITKSIWITEELKSHQAVTRNITDSMCKRCLSPVCDMMMTKREQLHGNPIFKRIIFLPIDSLSTLPRYE
jgi:hypothetical protein